MTLTRRIIQVYSQYWKAILLLFFMGISLSILELLGISVVLPILDDGSTATKIPFPLSMVSELFIEMQFNDKLRYIALILVVIYFLKGIFFYINGILGTNLERSISKNFVLNCYKGISKVNISYIDANKESELFTKAVAYAGGYGNVIKLISNIIPMIFTLLLLLTTLLIISPIMLGLSLSIAILASLIVRKVYKKRELAGAKIAQSNMALNSLVIEEISAIKARRLSNSTNQSIKFVRRGLNIWSENFVNLEKIVLSIRPIIELLGILALALILVVFSYFLVDRGFFVDSAATILTFLLIFTRTLTPISSLNASFVAIKANMPYFKVTEDFLSELDQHKIDDGDINIDELKNSIQFKNVFFSYNQENNNVLNDISFSIPVGAKVGIVGLSGSGKSSLIDLLLKHYKPSSGEICIDGIDLNKIKSNSWYDVIGVVSQDPFFFDGSINYNISFSHDVKDTDKIIEAAKKAHIHEFITSLPNGYDSKIGGRGDLLSGGQKQRIAIARALFHDPNVLIFDEATSALDSETEDEIRIELGKLLNKTSITVAHRLSTIVDSDIIIVMDKGKIIQLGNLDDLEVLKDGKFYELFFNQLNNEI